jgi:5-methylcytosine-specific restriction protein A
MDARFKIKVGDIISNDDIVKIFKCGNMGGMRRSHKTNSLVLTMDYTKGFYKDSRENDRIKYTGMGKYGNMRLDFAQNKTLNESNTNGVNIHVFEVNKPKQYCYLGEAVLDGKPYQDFQYDVDHNKRIVWIFPLRLLSQI